MKTATQFLLVAVSGVMLAGALPNELWPYGSVWLGFIALAPYFLALYHSRSFKVAVWLGAVFGAVSTIAGHYWLLFFQDFAVWTLGGTVLGYIIFQAALAPILRGVARGYPALRPYLLATVWTVYEFLKSIGFLGFPWGLIAYPLHQVPVWIQLADITGVWGLSLLMALANAVVCELVLQAGLGVRLRDLWQSPAVLVALFALNTGYGSQRLATVASQAPVTTIDMVLVQHNQDPWTSGDVRGSLESLQRLTDAGIDQAPGRPDLVVWSETALTYPVTEARDYYMREPPDRPLLPYVASLNTYVLTGAPVYLSTEPLEIMNSAVLLGPAATLVDFYGKQHPVPFAESVPFWEVPAIRSFFSKVIGLQAAWVSGARQTIFRIPVQSGGTVAVATPICFEDAFAGVCRRFVLAGADVLINLTNDSWSRRVSAETQHHVVALFRAIETRRVLVRATNAGVTAVIGPDGGSIAGSRLPLFQEGAVRLAVPVYVPDHETVYTRFGDYFPLTLAAALLLGLGGSVVSTALRRRADRM